MYSTNTARSRINSFQNHNRKRGYYHQDEFNPKSSCTKTNFCSRIITSSQIRPTHIFQHKPFLMSVSQVLLFKSSFSNTFHPNLSIHAANLYQLSSDLSNRQCLPQTKTTLIKSTHLLPTPTSIPFLIFASRYHTRKYPNLSPCFLATLVLL